MILSLGNLFLVEQRDYVVYIDDFFRLFRIASKLYKSMKR